MNPFWEKGEPIERNFEPILKLYQNWLSFTTEKWNLQKFHFSHTQVLKKDSRDANIGVGITTYLYRSLLGLPLKFNTVSTVWKFECL